MLYKHYFALTALLAVSSIVWAKDYQDYARVESAVPEYQRVYSPRHTCYSEYVPEVSHGPQEYAGTVIGGITGGVIGSQIGQGNGNRAATVAGAIAGAIIGDRVQQHHTRYAGYAEREVRSCRTVGGWKNRFMGYRVTYEYAGQRYTTRLPENPGPQLPVRISQNVRPLNSW